MVVAMAASRETVFVSLKASEHTDRWSQTEYQATGAGLGCRESIGCYDSGFGLGEEGRGKHLGRSDISNGV